MPLFQNTVVEKFLKTLNKVDVTTKWEIFKNHFHNQNVQDDIKNLKEEQYQGEFLEDLFVKILGYTKPASSSETKFNLTTEYKNVKDSKKADGAIIINEVVKAVIELKGTETTDLNKIEAQAFGYKNNQPECTYVITSNFEKLRFYIDNAIEHIEFNLFTLTEKDFELLYLCLAYENIKKDIPKKIKEESVSTEDAITKKLYNDYSLFKRELHQNLVILNPQFDALELFKKSQKLLDRFLFLFFAEDRQLLPPNSVRLILEQWIKLKDLDAYTPLFDRFKKYFGYLNTGFKGKQYDVYAYNGGLFKPDAILDNILIDDNLLYKHTLKLSEYDFDSEIDVNILGHIFENSLNELDEIKAQLEGLEIDKSKSKRKKDGVFYTPKYITKYIVENTVGKLCEEKKAELEINDEEYFSTSEHAPISISTRKHAPLPKKKKQVLLNKLTEYRKWLLQLTICDPACGSGAFLNQALDFLIKEHRYIDELQAKLFGDAMVLSDVEKSILENNLFGVDLNEESVEIAKLSLWLRTAQPNRKLNDLNNNIKCGNSLIDDVAIAGDKAFNWHQEFPQIFKEINKKAFHITTAVHDSSTSQRMIDFKVREKRDLGTNPYPNISYFNEEDDLIITQTIAQIVKEDKLNVLAYNICSDHIHLLLVCEEEDVSKIVQKIKSITAKNYHLTREHAPLASTKTGQLDLLANTKTREHAPLLDSHPHQPLWTQKFGCKEITTEDHLFTAIKYIDTNRSKHHLPQLSRQINNIIDDFICDYNTAFKPEYTGGFDVVIGNPPYGAKLDNETQKHLNQKYIKGGSETAISFIKLSYDLLLKKNGYFGFIIPKAFTFSSNYEAIRDYVLDDINEIIDCKKVWKEVLLEQIIFFFKKNNKTEYYNCGKLKNNIIEVVGEIEKINFEKFGFFLNDISNEELNIGLKVRISNKYIKDFAHNSRGGIFQNKITEVGDTEVLGGAEIQRNGIVGVKGKVNRELIKDDSKCFINNNSILVQNLVAHIENPTDHIKITACLPESKEFAIVDTINQLTFINGYSNKAFWLLLNSKLLNWYCYRFIYARAIRTMHFDNSITNRIPIPINFQQQPFIEKADLMLSLNKELQEVSQKFQRSLQRKFFDKGACSLDKVNLPKNLQNWHQLTYASFIKELFKNKIKLSLSEEAEWEDYFLQERKKTLDIKTQIETTDKEINKMVYELYGLTKEEIEIVENS